MTPVTMAVMLLLVPVAMAGQSLSVSVLVVGEALFDGQRSSERRVMPPPGDPTGGEELYNASCVVCHGAGAMGGIGPRLAGNPVLMNQPAFEKVLSEGRHMMPPLKDTLTPQQLADIHAWLKSLR
jgi:mono/diheme cytochrome c family protein